MSLEDPTEEEQAYLNDALRYGCSRIISAVLLTILLLVLGMYYIPAPVNTYLLLILVVWSLSKISLWSVTLMLGPPPEIPESLKKEVGL